VPVLTVGWGDVLVTLHVLGATVWVGGQLMLAGLVPVLRRAAPEAVPLVARTYARLAWTAFALLVVTGVLNVVTSAHGGAAYRRTLTVKLALVLLSAATAFAHQRARRTAARAWTAATSLATALVAVLLGVVLGGHG
jgi:putative copper export protein